MLVFLSGVGQAVKAGGESVYWTNLVGGDYFDSANWSPNRVPLEVDTLVFTNSSAYRLNVNESAVNSAAIFSAGVVTQQVSSGVWMLKDAWQVGDGAGITSRVAFIGGVMAVTNEAGTGTLRVGGSGTGELAIRGGEVVTDWFVATNGSRSIVTLGNGILTTFRGSVVTNSGKLVVGSSPKGVFTWNILGGANRILTAPFDYGGLTLGDSGRARINLSGSNTVLSVGGLDTSGTNELSITDGANLRTERVQLGLGAFSGGGNKVVISGPGSAWTNTSLIYFGMHSGAQTMIVTNGGCFRTGGDSFTGFNNAENRIIITGSNSCFHIDGVARLAKVWGTPVRNLNNLLLVTNGGRFFARSLGCGSGGTLPGTLIDIADGTLSMGWFGLEVGTLRIGAGTGIIDQLSLTGGTNAIIRTEANLLVGHYGDLRPGELRVGQTSGVISSLNGELQLGGWQIGALTGSAGDVTMTGGRVFVTNDLGTGAVVVGGNGQGKLSVTNGLVCADRAIIGEFSGGSGMVGLNGPESTFSVGDLSLGPSGWITASNSATLRFGSCSGPSASVRLEDAVVEFTTGCPAISDQSIQTARGLISFAGAVGANVDLNDPAVLGKIQHTGSQGLRLRQSTNSALPSLVFRDNDSSTWSRLIVQDGVSAVQADNILVDTNSSLAATNAEATISGTFTNCGRFALKDSTLRFTGPVTLTATSTIDSVGGVLIFSGGLHLPATDVLVLPGLKVQVSSIVSDGGKLIIAGGCVIPNENGTVPPGVGVSDAGWVTYIDTVSAPITLPDGLEAAMGLELIRSTNVPVSSYTFSSGIGGYERLRLGTGSRWMSRELVIGHGGSMFLADDSAQINLGSGLFRVEQGGKLYGSATNHAGFSPSSSNSITVISGTDSTWQTPGTLSIGAAGANNLFVVESGARLVADSAIVSADIRGGTNNSLVLAGPDAVSFCTNGLAITGSRNQFLVRTGAAFFGLKISARGWDTFLSLSGTGAVVNCSSDLAFVGHGSLLRVENGSTLSTSNLVVSGTGGNAAVVSGRGSSMQISGTMSIYAPPPSVYTNSVSVADQGTITAPSVVVSSGGFGGAVLAVDAGQLYVTNSLGTGSLTLNGRLRVDRGFLKTDKLAASLVGRSVIDIGAGRVEWKNCDIATGIPLRIGDGTQAATLCLLGGTSICRSGLEIRPYSRLTGEGVITGPVTNWGTLLPVALKIQGDLRSAPSSSLGFTIKEGLVDATNTSLVVTGSVSLGGTLRLSVDPGVAISSTQTFRLIECDSVNSEFANVVFGQRLATADRLGSFRIVDTGHAIEATDYQSEDRDGDGVEDAWATNHFSFSPLLPGTGLADLHGDWDGDGLDNLHEFLFGTDPRNAASTLALSLKRTGPQCFQLRFPVAANAEVYLETTKDLSIWTETLIDGFSYDPDGAAVWSGRIDEAAGGSFYRLLVRIGEHQ